MSARHFLSFKEIYNMKVSAARQRSPKLFVLLSKDNLACFSSCVHIDHALIAAAAELKRQIFFSLYKRAVDQKVGIIEEPGYGFSFLRHLQEPFIGISGEGDKIQSPLFYPFCQPMKGFRLTKRLAAGKGDAGQQWVFADFF